MKHEQFIDTSGFYAILAKHDSKHTKARTILQDAAKKRSTFVTTDYVIDETATLLHAKGLSHILPDLFDIVFESHACIIEWMDQDRFRKTRTFFLKHRDHSWSFTDCFSFLVMKELRITEVVSKDKHFKEAGFTSVL